MVLDARATPQMALRMEAVETLANELFLLQTCGDDRAVVETYVMGKAMKSGARPPPPAPPPPPPPKPPEGRNELMANYLDKAGLQVDTQLVTFIETEALPG